jgi:hypothetical protein
MQVWLVQAGLIGISELCGWLEWNKLFYLEKDGTEITDLSTITPDSTLDIREVKSKPQKSTQEDKPKITQNQLGFTQKPKPTQKPKKTSIADYIKPFGESSQSSNTSFNSQVVKFASKPLPRSNEPVTPQTAHALCSASVAKRRRRVKKFNSKNTIVIEKAKLTKKIRFTPQYSSPPVQKTKFYDSQPPMAKQSALKN